jgi:ferredoxin, 2Fe-2S
MAEIKFIEHDGAVHTVNAELGSTVMEAARANGVKGIVAECGGACACATCQVYIDEAWKDKLSPPSTEEEDQLDNAFDVRSNSRLSCQIQVTEELSGLVVRLPAYQGR